MSSSKTVNPNTLSNMPGYLQSLFSQLTTRLNLTEAQETPVESRKVNYGGSSGDDFEHLDDVVTSVSFSSGPIDVQFAVTNRGIAAADDPDPSIGRRYSLSRVMNDLNLKTIHANIHFAAQELTAAGFRVTAVSADTYKYHLHFTRGVSSSGSACTGITATISW